MLKEEILTGLQLKSSNKSASTDKNWWSETTNLGEIVSYNPTTGEPIGSVYNCSEADYEKLVKTAEKTFQTWREVPAPKRGCLID